MAEWGGLENRCSRKATVGSNPTLSAFARLRTLRQEALQANDVDNFEQALEFPG